MFGQHFVKIICIVAAAAAVAAVVAEEANKHRNINMCMYSYYSTYKQVRIFFRFEHLCSGRCQF